MHAASLPSAASFHLAVMVICSGGGGGGGGGGE